MTIRHCGSASWRSLRVLGACGLALFLTAGPAFGGLVLRPGTYVLGDHLDGNAGPPSYGLRLDELVDVTPGHDIFTFSFDAPGTEMRIDITEMSTDEYELRIYGTASGGLVQNNAYVPAFTSLVDIDFVYTLAHPVDGDDDYIVTTPNFTNTGMINYMGAAIDLFDRANSDGYTFRLGDEDDHLGHRGVSGVSGWGWLDHGTDGTYVPASDWLFTVIPTPGSAALLSVALVFGARRNSRRTTQTRRDR